MKPWKQTRFDTFLRVSIGSIEDNDKFIADLRACSNKAEKGLCQTKLLETGRANL